MSCRQRTANRLQTDMQVLATENGQVSLSPPVDYHPIGTGLPIYVSMRRRRVVPPAPTGPARAEGSDSDLGTIGGCMPEAGHECCDAFSQRRVQFHLKVAIAELARSAEGEIEGYQDILQGRVLVSPVNRLCPDCGVACGGDG